MNQAFQDIEEVHVIGQYNEQAAAIFQIVNGENFLSQGGIERVDFMIGDIDIENKKVLDFGCGLAGPALHLVKKHKAIVHGVDVDPELIEKAEQNAKKHNVEDRLTFTLINSNKLPFADCSFDIILSKEAIVHVKNKQQLFEELFRVLKPGGNIIILDWFKQENDVSIDLKQTLELDKLTMHYTDIDKYANLLRSVGFSDASAKNCSEYYLNDIKKDCINLKAGHGQKIKEIFGDKVYAECLITWQAHVNILETKEVQTFLIKAKK